MAKKNIRKELIMAPMPVLIIGTYDENGVPNAMNAAWGTQCDTDAVTIFLSKHKTTENLKLKKAFTVAFATKETLKESDYFGIESGKGINKIEKAGFHTRKAEFVDAPVIEEYPDIQNDGLTFVMHNYQNGTDDSRVSFIKVNNGMHRWYTGGSYDINYTEEIAKFFTGTIDVTDVAETTSESLNVYPNPANDFIQVEGNVSLYDLCGKLVMKGFGRIDVSSLPEGMYFVKSGNNCTKLIVNR